MSRPGIAIIIFLFLHIQLKTSGQTNSFTGNPMEITFHTSDIITFWKVYDKTFPQLDAAVFQKEYINAGSEGLKGFIKYRIESGKNLSKTVKNNLSYYQAIRESSLSIDARKDRFYECFNNLKKIYPEAVFPDVYFVIGAKNSGGTTFKHGLIIGAEMFGVPSTTFTPVLDIEFVDEVVAHELIHFQQQYAANNTLLAQCIREGSADFIGELIAGSHSNVKIYEYGNAHEKELWNEFTARMNDTNWNEWLYYSKDKSRPKDLGYWIGYQITKAYYTKMDDKATAIKDILTITDFQKFLENSGYPGK